MGLETHLPFELTRINDLQQLRTYLEQTGWHEVNFGFNLGRHTGALDFQKENKRLLCYQSTKQDSKSYQLLTSNQVPAFPTTFSSTDPNNSIGFAGVHPGARALDSLQFPDQQPSTKYLGSYEILASVARLLANIYKKTSTIPEGLKLQNLALIVGKTDNIRLIPPLNLVLASDWSILANQLLEDMSSQDPIHDHHGQIKTFKNHFEISLKK